MSISRRKNKNKSKSKIRKIRKEDNLCVVLRRDLDSCVLFQGNAIYSEQYDIKNNRKQESKQDIIDFLIYYHVKGSKNKDLFFGIEAKAERPNMKHFSQANRYYNDGLNGIFLAYPESMIAKAFEIKLQNEEFNHIGLISLNPYKSQICNKAYLNIKFKMKRDIIQTFEIDHKEPYFENDSRIIEYNNSISEFKLFLGRSSDKGKSILEFLSLLIANYRVRGIDSDLPNSLPAFIDKKLNYSINHLLGSDAKQKNYDILQSYNIIELDRGYSPYMYMFTEYAQQEDIFKLLKELCSSSKVNEYEKIILKIFKELYRKEKQHSFY